MAFEVTVAFPVIGAPVPPVTLPPEQFLDQVARDGAPHWLYHLRVRHNRQGRFASPLWGVGPEHLEELAAKLGLPGGFTLHPTEFVPGEYSRAECSPYAFGYPLAFAQGSAYLALAVGLAAAHARRPLPNWLLLSGSLLSPFRDDLRFRTTTGIEEKVLLTLGARPDYQVRPLLDRLYQDPATPRYLGRRGRRVQPGRVRLMLVPTDDIDIHPLEFSAPLEAWAVEVPPDCFGQPDFAVLEAQLRGLAGDDLLLVQVPTPFHALRLLGYPIPPTAARDDRPLHAFCVRQLPAAGGPQPLDEAGGSGVRQELEALEYRLAKARAFDVYTKLTVILDRCRRLLHCESGDVSALGPDPDWLRVMVRRCRALGDLPHFVARRPAPGIDALGETTLISVPRAAEREEYRAARSEDNPLRRRFGADKFRHYQRLLGTVGAYVKVPLLAGGRVIGVMYLHRAREGPFHPAMLRLVEALAGRAAQEVAAFLADEAAALWHVAPLYGPGSARELARLAADLPGPGAQTRLGGELARLARQRTGAYRVAVRLLAPDGRRLLTVGFDGIEGLPGGEEGQAPPLALTEDSAAAYAALTGDSYVVPDASQPGLRLRPVEPLPRSHTAVPLRAGGHTLGVLSADWDRVAACDVPTQALLEELAGRYALALRARGTDDLFARLERLCRVEGGPGYNRALCLVAQMTGGQEAVLFLRAGAEERYRIAASLRGPGWPEGGHVCEPGVGLAGWAAARNEAVRVSDLRDAAALAALGLGPDVPEARWGTGVWAGLAVPLSVDGEVLGVLLVLSAHGGFDAYDQQAALAAASRLAGWILQRPRASERTWGPGLHAPLSESSRKEMPGNETAESDDVLASFVAEFRQWVVDLNPAFGYVWVAAGGGEWRCLWGFGESREDLAHLHFAGNEEAPLLAESAWLTEPGGEPDAPLRPLLDGLRPGLRARLVGLCALCVPVASRDGRPLALVLLTVPPPAEGPELLRRARVLASLCRIAFDGQLAPGPARSPSYQEP